MKLLIVGGDSLTGLALQDLLTAPQIGQNPAAPVDFKVLNSKDSNLLHKMEVAKAVSRIAPSIVINVASYAHLELAEKDPDAARLCDEQNALVPAVLAEVCAHLSLPLIQHSSSFVFDGQKSQPYSEEDTVNPVCRYGRSKWYGERAIRDALPAHLILRTDWVFSPRRPTFFQRNIDLCKAGKGAMEVLNLRFCPTPADDVARVLLAVAHQIDCAADVWGTYHYTCQQSLNQEAFVEHILQEAAHYDSVLAESLHGLRFTQQAVQLPHIPNTVLTGQKLFETFGIRPRTRNPAVTAVVRQIYGVPLEISPSSPLDAPVPKPVASKPLTRRSGGVRRSKKGVGKKG